MVGAVRAPGRASSGSTTSRCGPWRRSGSTCRRPPSTRWCAAGASCSSPTPRPRCASGAGCCARAADLALAVWAPPDANPWLVRLHRLLTERGLAPASDPGEPGPFALADGERLAELLWGAGLTEVRVEPLDFAYRAASLDDWWEHALATSQRAADAVAGLSPAEHYALRDAFDAAYAEFADADGAVAIPARTLVAVAEA